MVDSVKQNIGVSTVLGAAGAGAAAGAAAGKLTPVVTDALKSSVQKQKGILDSFQKSGLSVKEYMSAEKAKGSASFLDFGKVFEKFRGVVHNLDANAPTAGKEAMNLGENYERFIKEGSETIKKGLNETEKIITKGKVSTSTAIKDTAKTLAQKAKDGVSSLAKKASNAKASFTGAENKGEFVAEKLNGAKDTVVKKAGTLFTSAKTGIKNFIDAPSEGKVEMLKKLKGNKSLIVAGATAVAVTAGILIGKAVKNHSDKE